MATTSENLIALNQAKANIKQAIENKGQDLTNVPFTQYAEKINAIKTGGTGGGEDLTELTKRELFGTYSTTWEANNFTIDDGTTYESIKLVFESYGYNGADDPVKYVSIYLNGQKTNDVSFYSIENTTIKFMSSYSGDAIGTLNYSIENGTLVADETKPSFKKVQLTADSVLGYWEVADRIKNYSGVNNADYFNFREDYFLEKIKDNEVIGTSPFYFDGGKLFIDFTNSGRFGSFPFNSLTGSFTDSGYKALFRLIPDGTIDITEEGEHYVLSYLKANVDMSEILNTEV